MKILPSLINVKTTITFFLDLIRSKKIENQFFVNFRAYRWFSHVMNSNINFKQKTLSNTSITTKLVPETTFDVK